MGITSSSGADFSLQLYQQGQQLARIERLLAGQKETLTLEEASAYSGISKSYLYKLTSSGTIPHYKPEGKIIYFDRAELNSWLKRNRVKTTEEIEQETADYVRSVPFTKKYSAPLNLDSSAKCKTNNLDLQNVQSWPKQLGVFTTPNSRPKWSWKL
jgi:excisionase family DNA binding protein